MIEGKILVARREDLREPEKHKPLEDISIVDFSQSNNFRDILHADFVLFIDDDNRERIFKSRWGKDSVIF
jgi:hypothetical protein